MNEPREGRTLELTVRGTIQLLGERPRDWIFIDDFKAAWRSRFGEDFVQTHETDHTYSMHRMQRSAVVLLYYTDTRRLYVRLHPTLVDRRIVQSWVEPGRVMLSLALRPEHGHLARRRRGCREHWPED